MKGLHIDRASRTFLILGLTTVRACGVFFLLSSISLHFRYLFATISYLPLSITRINHMSSSASGFKYTKKRKFHKKWNKRKTVRRAFGTGAFDLIKAHGPTFLKFAKSYICKQPLPDRYDTWLFLDNYGHYPSGGSVGSAAFSLNNLDTPLNLTGGLALALPNPVTSVATAQFAGLRNLLVNATTGTGIWNFCRVWSIRVDLWFEPSSLGTDTVNVAMAPVTGNTAAYLTVVTCGQGPNSTVKSCTQSVADKMNTLSNLYSMPQLCGISQKEYAADDTHSFNLGAAAPNPTVYLNIQWGTADALALAAALPWKLRLAAHVEFYGRVDSALLDL